MYNTRDVSVIGIVERVSKDESTRMFFVGAKDFFNPGDSPLFSDSDRLHDQNDIPDLHRLRGRFPFLSFLQGLEVGGAPSFEEIVRQLP